MYNTLSAIDTALGDNIGSIATFRYAPIEWLVNDVIVDLSTGTVLIAPTLIAGKAWLNGACLYKTCEYSEKDKADKPGNYMEATLAGTVLKDDKDRHMNLATHRYHQFVVIYKDNNSHQRIIGTKKKGMTFSADYTSGKTPADASLYNVSFVHQMADPAPYYEGL